MFMQFKPVWISSPEHLALFGDIFKKTSWLRRVIGAYKSPLDFPCIQIKGMFGPARIPIIMFSQGQLEVENQLIRFRSANWPSPAGERFNLINDWEFQLHKSDIRLVEKFEQQSPVLKYYNMNFTRVQTNKPDVLGDLLLCVGGSGPSMKNIRRRSEELQQELLKLKF